jgi:hypothetical protein
VAGLAAFALLPSLDIFKYLKGAVSLAECMILHMLE